MGTRWGENKPEDHVRYARIDLMGLVREDLLFDMARHVDSTVHQFEEWGLPIMKDPKTGRYLREGRWQIMIHGESYKPIVAEAAKKSADKVFNRICVTHLLMDESKPNRIAGAVGFNVRTGKEVWRAGGMKESWNTPILVDAPGGKKELVVAIMGSVLGFDPDKYRIARDADLLEFPGGPPPPTPG
mgnify:CR=1 FL=1